MMAVLFRYEIKKLLSRRLVWLLLAVCLGLLVWAGWETLGAGTSGRVRGMKDVYKNYEGRVVTEAFKKEARMAFEEYAAAHPEHFDSDRFATDQGYYRGVWDAYNKISSLTSSESRQDSMTYMEAALESGKDESGNPLPFYILDGYKAEVKYGYMAPVIHYAEGWHKLLVSSGSVESIVPGAFLLLMLGLGLLPLFSTEHSARMENVVLCTANRGSAALTKMLAASCFAGACTALFYGVEFLSVAFSYGLDGASLPVSSMDSWIGFGTSMPIGTYFLLSSLATVSAAVACAALVALSSALFRHPPLSLLCAGAIVAFQIVLADTINHTNYWTESPVWYNVDLYIDRLPAMLLVSRDAGGMASVVNDLIVFGLPAVVSALCFWLAPRQFLKRRKA